MGTETSSRPREGGEFHTLRFGVFEMDIRSGELRRSGAIVRLQPQPFKVLALLAGRPGEVVTREEIQAEVWPAGTFVDFEQSLNFCIRQIRAALGDSAVSPRYVETLPRRGYRWVGGTVERIGPPATVHEWPRPVPVEPTNGNGTAGSALSDRDPARRRHLTIAVGALAIGVAAVSWVALHRTPLPPPPEFQRVTFRRGAVMSARFGPEHQVVYVASWEGQPWGMHLVSVGARESRAMGVERAYVVAASDTEVAFIRGGVLARAPLAGGPPREVAQSVIAADWTADATDFAVARSVDRRIHLEYPIGHDLGETPPVGRLRLSPDGTLIALEERVMTKDDRGRVVVVDREGRRLVETGEYASLEGLAWSVEGDEVWFTGALVGAESQLHALSLDGSVRTLYSAMGRLVLHDILPSGDVLLERTAFRAETFFRRRGDRERELTWLDVSGVEGITADGSTVLLVESGEGGGPDYMSYLRRTDGSLPVKLASGNGTSLSRDGRSVLVIPLRDPDHVDIVPAGPGEPHTVKIPGALRHDRAVWLPDGRSFYVTTRDAEWKFESWLFGPEGGEPRLLPVPEGRMLMFETFSPDGSRFALACPDSQAMCTYDVETGAPRPVPGVSEDWYPVKWDETGIYLRERGHHLPETVRRVDPATGRVETLFTVEPRDTAGALGIGRVVIADGGEAWAYSVLRRLSDLYVVTGLH